ncbi:MAG: hypothetical protein IKX51_03975, partial [Bacteroidales bacterium]|nr:hypothetical protein [Bacteroidales bacterium]
VLCVAGIFSAKAQYSPSDSAYACDLNYTSINTSSIPATTTDTLYLSRGSKILKDIRYGHRANGYALNATRDMALDIQLLSGSWDAYLFLLDSNFNQIAYDDDWDGMSSSYGSHILTAITAGQYYILVSEYSYDTNPLSYTLTIDTIATTPFNQLTYTPLATFTDTTVFDTFLSSYPNHPFFMWGENNIFKAKGYSFQGSQNQLITVRDNNYNAVYVLMDNNYNILKAGEHFFTHLLQQTGTYYLALLGSYENARSETNIKLIQCNYRTYYVDNINGDDSRNGLTLGTAIKTLDTALARSNGVGKYYLTEDYEFTNENPLGVYYGEIYPYQKDIRLYMPTNSGHDVIRIYGTLKFGEQDSNYYFIIDSSTTDGYDDILDADYPSTYLEVNNMKIRNSYIPSTVFWGDDIVLRNCEFTNDTVEDEFIGMDQSTYNSLKLINCTISQNTFYEDLIYQDYDNLRLTLENTTVSGNTLSYIYPAFFYKATINLTSGSWRNNTLDSNYRY